MKKKLLSIIVAVTIVISLVGITKPVYAADVDPSAPTMELGKEYKVSGVHDGWFKFKTTDYNADYYLNAKVTGGYGAVFWIYDSDGAPVISEQEIMESSEGGGFWCSLKKNSTYYVYYRGYGRSEKYLCYFIFDISPETDLGDDIKEATPYTFGKEITEYRRIKYDDEWVTFTTPSYESKQILYVKDIDCHELNFEILDADGTNVFSKEMHINDKSNEYTETFEFKPNKKYYLHFSNYYTGKFKFSIKLKKTESGGGGSSDNNKKNYSNEWVNGKWYNADGTQTYKGTLSWKNDATGWWIDDGTGWYPTNSWQKIDGTWYFFKPDGYMASNEYYNGYWFNKDGSWDGKYFLSWKQNSTGWWVEDVSGWWPASSWLKIDGYWYYFDASGYMVTSQYVDGYWISADGVCY